MVVASVTALLFAVHPMMTQAVGYISARSEVAYAALFLLAFLSGRRWMLGGGKRWWILCVGLWIVAMPTKESAAMLSFVLLAYDWFLLDAPWSERRRRFLKLGLPLLAITFLVGGAGRLGLLMWVEHRSGGARLALRAGRARCVLAHVAILFVPRDQSIFQRPAVHRQLARTARDSRCRRPDCFRGAYRGFAGGTASWRWGFSGSHCCSSHPVCSSSSAAASRWSSIAPTWDQPVFF